MTVSRRVPMNTFPRNCLLSVVTNLVQRQLVMVILDHLLCVLLIHLCLEPDMKSLVWYPGAKVVADLLDQVYGLELKLSSPGF